MTQRIELSLDQAAFEQLHKLADSKKSEVRVSREELSKLLRDYSVLLAAAHQSTGIKVIEPTIPRQRPRLGRG
jgi:hypothetical protein